MRTKVCALGCALVLTSLLPGTATSAEEASPPRLLVVDHATVDPAEVDEFESWFKDWVTAFQGSGLGADYNWHTSSGPGFNYLWVSPISDYSVLGAREERQKQMSEAIGEETLGQLLSKMHLMKGHFRELLRMRPELSYAGREDAVTAPEFLRIEVHHVRPGMEERYEGVVKQVKEAFAKADQPHGWDGYSVEFGEGSYVFTSIASSAADYHTRPTVPQVLAKELGEEGASKIMAEWRECISQFSRRDAQGRPELSFVAAPAGQ
jgi:hypothetical protein